MRVGLPWAMQYAVDHDTSAAYGAALGLTVADTQEVINVWLTWYSNTTYPVSWARIREALAARASGTRWRP